MTDPEGSQEPTPSVRRGWVRVLIFVPVLFAAAVVVQVPVELWLRSIGAPPAGGETGDQLIAGVSLIRHLASAAATFLAVFLMCRAVDRRSLASFGVTWRISPAGLLEGVAWGVGLIAMTVGLLWATGQVAAPRWLGVQDLGELTAVALLFLVASTTEELIFRAYLLTNLVPSLGRFPAIAVSSLLFAFAHQGNPDINGVAFLNILLAGVLLGVAYSHRLRFWPVVWIHMAWNFAQGPIFGFDVSGMSAGGMISFERGGGERWTGGEFGLEGSVLTVLVLAAASVLMEWRESRAAKGTS